MNLIVAGNGLPRRARDAGPASMLLSTRARPPLTDLTKGPVMSSATSRSLSVVGKYCHLPYCCGSRKADLYYSCIVSGFRCDGYPAVPNKRDNSSPPSEEPSPESSASDSRSSVTTLSTRSDTTAATSIGSPSTVATPMILTPTEPYVNSERQSLNFFIDVTASMVSRSRAAPYFWKKLVLQAAWSYPSVRHAVLGSAISSESLIRRDSDSLRCRAAELRALDHTAKAMRSLLSGGVPLDVVLLTSAALGILDLFNGHWDTACTHITYGARLAKQARQDPHNEPFIAFYCEAFASALPLILTHNENGGSVNPAEKNSIVRLDEAVRSLKLAIVSFDQTLPKLLQYTGRERDRIVTLIRNARAETDWILPRWDNLLHEEMQRSSPPDDAVKVDIHGIESPFSMVMDDLHRHLDFGGPFDIAKFEVAVERTMPFYTLAKAGPHLKMRQTAVQLMCIGAELRGKRAMTPADSPTLTRAPR